MVPILRTIVELDPNDVEAKLELGRLLVAGGALDQGLELANAAIKLDGHNASAFALRGAVLLLIKDASGAKRDAKAALEIDPANAGALIVLAAERAAGGDVEGALLILDRQATAHEKDIGIQLFKLSLFDKLKDSKRAEALLRKLSELYPQEHAFQIRLARLYMDQKRPDDAEKELRALAADPSDVEAGLNVVRFLQRVKGPAVAREELLSRIKVGANVFKYQLALAEFDFAQGRADDSIQLLEKLISDARVPNDAMAAQVVLAQLQFSRKNFDTAKTLVASILRKDNRNLDGLKLQAQLRLEQGQVDAAVTDLRQALNDQPQSKDLMVLLATAYERSGSIELAEKQYADATRASNFDVGIGLTYAAFLQRRGNIERAEDILTQLARRWPNNIAVLTRLADVKLVRQNWIGAQAIAEAIQQIGGGGVADQIQAAALIGRGKYDDSIKILESVYAAAPSAEQPIAALVDAMVRTQQLERAATFLQSVLKHSPENIDAHILMGSVQLQKNAPKEALQSFQAAIELQPKQAAGYLALSGFYLREKNIDEAEKVVRTGLAQQPDNFPLHQTLAVALERKGDYEAAIAEYEVMLKQQPGSLIAANNLASLISEHRTDKANLEHAYSVAAILRKSQIPSFKDTLGWIEYLRGDYKTATGLLEEAAAALPDRALVQYHLGMSYVATGQTAKASEQFKKALALVSDSALQQKIRTAQEKVAM
jgi:predicted Zn-dependent protease